jgi:AcrR family transcriptional regulator
MVRTPRSAASTARRADAEARTLAVVEELLRDGASFAELSVERIAAQAGLSRSTFYLYFGDKTELVVRLAHSLKSATFETGTDWDSNPPESGLDWLANAYHRIIRDYRERPAALAAVQEAAAYEPAVREVLDAEKERFADRIAGRLRHEQQAGRTAAGLDAVLAARVMVWGGEHVIASYVAGTPADAAMDVKLARELAESHWYGVYRRPEARSVGNDPGPDRLPRPADKEPASADATDLSLARPAPLMQRHCSPGERFLLRVRDGCYRRRR